MVKGPQGISVGHTRDQVYVEVAGRGSFQNSQPLRRFALEMIERGCGEFVVDLGSCVSMDSTFLGVLAGIGLRLQQDGRRGRIHIINISKKNCELLQNLGLDRLFSVDLCLLDRGHQVLPADIPLQRLVGTEPEASGRPVDKLAAAKTMLDSHVDLMRADESNTPKFRDLTRMLREDIERREKKSTAPD